MSQKYHPVSEVAFFFTDDALALVNRALMSRTKTLHKRYASMTDEDFIKAAVNNELPESFYDVQDIMEVLPDLQVHGDFDGHVETFDTTTANEEAIEFDIDCDNIVYLPLDYAASYLNAPYTMTDDMVEEIRAQIGEYLSDGYNIAKNLCSICGTYFC